VQIPFLLRALTGASPTLSGLAIATSTLCSGLSGMFYGRLQGRLSRPGFTATTFLLMAAGDFLVGAAGSYAQVLAGLAVGGVGMGFLLPNSVAWLMALTPEARRGRAIGGLTAAVFAGQFLSPVFGQPVAARVGLPASFTVAAGVLLGLGLGFALGAWRTAAARGGRLG
jgi:MFS family permease